MRKTLFCVVLAVAALGAACGNGDGHSDDAGHAHGETEAQFDKAAADTAVDVDAADFRFDKLPASVKGPNVYFTVKNVGSTDHELEVIGPDGEPVGVVGPFKKGETKTLAVKLPPGTYSVHCLVEEGNTTHAELGMKNDLTVT